MNTNTYSSEDKRVLTDAEAAEVIDKIVGHLDKQGELRINVNSLWNGNQRWARNRAFETNDIRKIRVHIEMKRNRPEAAVIITLNQIDDKSIRDACRYIAQEQDHNFRVGYHEGSDFKLDGPTWQAKGISVWSDTTYNRTASENSELITSITQRAESKGMMCAGEIDTYAAHYMGYLRDNWGREERETGLATMAECSATVRHPKGVGSGWAGAASFDLKRIDLTKLGEIAFDKCIRSIDAVRIEPGRYQTILEPQATAAFAFEYVQLFENRAFAEGGNPLFHEYDHQIDRGRSRLGLKVADHRLNMFHDPEDPIIGTHSAKAMQKIDFLKNGVLTGMARSYDHYGLPQLATTEHIPRRWSVRMTGSEIVSVDEMISMTKRGLLMTRVSDMERIDEKSALFTGLTRDGLWLIENGKITKAVRNFRWTESPVFIFNNVDSIGESVPTMTSWSQMFPFMQGEMQLSVRAVSVPTIKINDFSFTSTIDAI